MFRLHEQVAVVTGGSRGIGRATSILLAKQGATVIVIYKQAESEAQSVVHSIEQAGGKAQAIQCDVSNVTNVEAVFAEISKRYGRIDILVANAGIALDGLLLRITEADFDQVFSNNVKSAIFCAKSVLKPMMKSRYGRVVFLSSVVGEMGNAGQALYSASKAALIGFTKTMAREYASRNITVNAVAPGFIDTDMTQIIQGDLKESLLKNIPLGRTGTPDEVAAAILFLAAKEASYITGQVLNVNGGMFG